MGDVTGYGGTAGAAIVRLHVAVLADALAGLGPADVVKRVDTLPDQLRTGEIATMVYVVADPGRGWLVANAGHPPPILIEPCGAARQLEIGHGRLRFTSVVAAPLPRRDTDQFRRSSVAVPMG